MPTRRPVGAALLAALGLAVGLVPARGQQIHRHTFAGKQPALVRGDANVKADEKDHDVSTNSFHSQPSSEHLSLTFADVAVGDAAFAHYHYPTPPAPVSPLLSAGVWVKATKAGVQLRARVVLPKEPDPANPQAPLTMLVVGTTYTRSREGWDKLTLTDVPALVGKHLPALQAKIGRPVNDEGAYVDRLVLNVYTGPGPVDVWVDDLDIGPVVRPPEPPAEEPRTPAVPTAQGKPPAEPAVGSGRAVEQRQGQLLVDKKAHFFRAVRYTGTPLHVLRAAGFDALWLPPDAAAETVADAAREGWFVIPSAPPVGPVPAGLTPDPAPFDAFRKKFAGSDVLFWDLGGGLTDGRVREVEFAASQIRTVGRRPVLGGDLWDGFSAYSQTLDVVGAHRWPLFTSLELTAYKDWLGQRKALAGSRPAFWTWVQNHVPDWYLANLAARPVAPGQQPPAPDPALGPHPEQVRQLAYLSIASGCRGLGFWSDRALADAAGGTDRLNGVALLNAELELLGPLLTSAVKGVERLGTSNPNVQAYLINAVDPADGKPKGKLLLPIWAGPGDQYVPAQAAVAGLKVKVPSVADGYDPWLVTPAGVECLGPEMKRVPGGVELTIPEFDTVAPVVFTDDVGANGLVAWWQDHARRYGRPAARWALDLARAEYEKVRAVHLKVVAAGGEVAGADRLFEQANGFFVSAQRHEANEQWDKAYKDATRALRPLRELMRVHWRQATRHLDVPSASPFAVSFATLPEHYELGREVGASRPGPSVLPHGGFDPPTGTIPKEGIEVGRVPGWSARTSELPADRVKVGAGVVPAEGLEDAPVNRERPPGPRTVFSPSRAIVPADAGYVAPAPELGKGVLKLEIRQTPLTDRTGKVVGAGRPLERTYLAVDGPPVRLPPGTLVRVSGWVKVPKGLAGTADGALLYDDAGGEPLAVRVMDTKPNPQAQGGVWKHYHLYRRVPASGQIGVTVALTGVGVAYFDDLRVEPLVVGADAAEGASGSAKGGWNRAGWPAAPAASPVVPAAGIRPWPGEPGAVIPAGGPPR